MKGQTTIYTEVEPFEDDFNDGNYTGWSAWSGTWSAANNYLRMTPGAAATIAKANTDNDLELRFTYVNNDTSDNSYYLEVSPRYATGGDRIYLNILRSTINIAQRVSGVWSSLDGAVLATTEGVEYTIRVVCDGQNVQVYRTAPGELEELVLETDSCTVASTNYITFTPRTDADFEIDDIRVLSDDLSNTTTFAVNNANELTSMTDYNGSTTFAFDAWGRMTSKARGSYAAAYGYKYGQMLCSATSNWPGEGDVTYDYGGSGENRQRTVGSSSEWFNWDGYSSNQISKEDESGNLTGTFVYILVEIQGPQPEAGQFVFQLHDNLDSGVSEADLSGNVISRVEFAPFGKSFSIRGFSHHYDYAGLAEDEESGMSSAIVRRYDPETTRWLTRDPVGFSESTNLYLYTRANPVNLVDPIGQISSLKGCAKAPWACAALAPPAGRIIQEANRAYPNLANLPNQWHHKVCRYLGGPANGWTVQIPAPYHQLITNEFRNLWTYGQGVVPNAQQLNDILMQVYSKYPVGGFPMQGCPL